MRREYSVLGDVVNMSARLMQYASANALCVVCDHVTQYSAKHKLSFTENEAMTLKGMSNLVKTFQPKHRCMRKSSRRSDARAPTTESRSSNSPSGSASASASASASLSASAPLAAAAAAVAPAPTSVSAPEATSTATAKPIVQRRYTTSAEHAVERHDDARKYKRASLHGIVRFFHDMAPLPHPTPRPRSQTVDETTAGATPRLGKHTFTAYTLVPNSLLAPAACQCLY